MNRQNKLTFIILAMSAVVIVIGALLLLPKNQQDENTPTAKDRKSPALPTKVKKSKEQQLADDIKAFGANDAEARQRVIAEGPGVLPALIKALPGGDRKTRDGVYQVVNKMVRNDSAGAARNFEHIIKNGASAEILEAIKLISTAGNPEVARSLYWAVNSSDVKVSKAAIKALQSSALSDPSLFGMLRDAYQKYGRDDKENEIIRSIGCVGKNDAGAAQFVMQIARESKDFDEKMTCVSALGNIGSPVVGDDLLGLSFKGAPNENACRLIVIQALADMKFKGAIKPLLEILKSDSSMLYREASLALKQITGEKDFPVLPPGATQAEAQKVASEWEGRLSEQK